MSPSFGRRRNSTAAVFAARALGVATAAYSAAVIARPAVLAGPCGWTDSSGGTTGPVRALVTAIGARDAVIGIAMIVAPAGTPLRAALLVRAACDAGDAVVLGGAVHDRQRRQRIVGVAAGWGALCALAAVAIR